MKYKKALRDAIMIDLAKSSYFIDSRVWMNIYLCRTDIKTNVYKQAVIPYRKVTLVFYASIPIVFRSNYNPFL